MIQRDEWNGGISLFVAEREDAGTIRARLVGAG
jgi:hypothetical protein